MKSLQRLREELRDAGFEERTGKGSHMVYRHPSGASISLPMNHPSHDAKGLKAVVARTIRSVQ